MRTNRPLLRRLGVVVGSVTLILLLGAAIEESVQRVLRGEELLTAVYQSIVNEYVEEVSPDALFRAGVEGMLRHTDPYAELIEQRENSEVDMLAKGVYHGLGIKVAKHGTRHVVSYIYDEIRPLTNLRLGDQLLRIDSVDLRTQDVTDLRPLLRGPAGSTVNLLVRRPGISDSLAMTVLRRSVTIDPLPVERISPDGILYLRLSRFTRSAADSVGRALSRARETGRVRGIVFDLRDNPGGLLEAAVAIADNFVPAGTPIVSMRGRQPNALRMYRARTDAHDATVPIALLVNARSASASEILAGAMQDLDRGIVIGHRTFGKGLVQTLIPLSYNAWLKLTTSRYYIPSGRCIQRLAYPEGKAARVESSGDNDPEFRTLRLARIVRESNGIVPDLVLPQDSLSPLRRCLERYDGYFGFVSLYINRNAPKSVPRIGAGIRADFRRYADSLMACEGTALSDAYDALRREARTQNLDASGTRLVEELGEKIRQLHARRFDTEWELIRARLEEEFIFHMHGDLARQRHQLTRDDAVQRAETLLRDTAAYEAAFLPAEQ